jgi:uncharacterized protein
MQTVMIRGAGTIGGLVTEKLVRRGVPVVIVSRRPSRFVPRQGVQVIDRADAEAQIAALKSTSVVINLEGKSISGVWTASAKREILASRTASVAHLAKSLSEAGQPPVNILQASATGYYGDRAAEILTENADPGSGFLADTCVEWESAALKSFDRERLAIFRIAPVLSNSGGVFTVWRRVFRAFLGGRVGAGAQYFSWIHEHDMSELLIHYLEHFLPGVINAAAPDPVTNANLTEILEHVFGRKAVMHMPAFFVSKIPGDFGREMLLASVRAIPKRALADGFEFKFNKFADAARDLA